MKTIEEQRTEGAEQMNGELDGGLPGQRATPDISREAMRHRLATMRWLLLMLALITAVTVTFLVQLRR